MGNYRHHYNEKYMSQFCDEEVSPPKRKRKNFLFYKNEIPSEPHGAYVDVIHTWNYDTLEEHHSYIQWLFPMYEKSSVNHRSQPLFTTEAKLMREDKDVCVRVMKSYRLLLGFFGLELIDTSPIPLRGDIRRTSTFAARFVNMVRHT